MAGSNKADTEKRVEMAIVVPSQGRLKGQHHFIRCINLKSVKDKDQKEDRSPSAVHEISCDYCRLMMKKEGWRPKKSTAPMPGPGTGPRPKTFFQHLDGFYHYRPDCPKYQAVKKKMEHSGIDSSKFPKQDFEDRADAEQFGYKPCPECARLGDINVPG
jgi:hypothetical protein